ncbi:MAG: hypothetical protein HFI31_16115 [Lachnospiraceae bacterium]|nr:hypothetical protein [Lachnospiraceae bacterium]
MAKPQLYRIAPFDAEKEHVISFLWTGNRAHANRIIIYDNDTNQEVFNDLVSTFELKHTIPPGVLTNGKKYVLQVQTYDTENIGSPLSDKVLFYTFQTPEFRFSNIPENRVITTASFTASVYYYSPDWEDLSTFAFYLYDSTKKQLLQSTTLTDSFDISYTFRGLENNTVYYIRAMGVTVNGMALDTDFTQVTVKYENPNAYSRIYTTTLPSQGCVQVASNLIIIQYNGTDQFTYEDGMIHLVDKTLYYDEGFLINGDFTLLIRGKNLWQTKELFKMKGGKLGLTLSSRIYQDGKLRFRLLVPNGIGHYLLYSQEQVFENEDLITIAVRRKNDVYQIKVFVELRFTQEGNMWYGIQRPVKGARERDTWVDTSESVSFVVDRNSCRSFLEHTEPIAPILHDLWLGGE